GGTVTIFFGRARAGLLIFLSRPGAGGGRWTTTGLPGRRLPTGGGAHVPPIRDDPPERPEGLRGRGPGDRRPSLPDAEPPAADARAGRHRPGWHQSPGDGGGGRAARLLGQGGQRAVRGAGAGPLAGDRPPPDG